MKHLSQSILQNEKIWTYIYRSQHTGASFGGQADTAGLEERHPSILDSTLKFQGAMLAYNINTAAEGGGGGGIGLWGPLVLRIQTYRKEALPPTPSPPPSEFFSAY